MNRVHVAILALLFPIFASAETKQLRVYHASLLRVGPNAEKVTPEERSTLDAWARGRTIAARLVQRAQIIRMAAQGILSQDIAKELDVSRPTVQLWRQRFLALRLVGLEKDAPRPGRVPRISPETVRPVVEATLHTKPPDATQ